LDVGRILKKAFRGSGTINDMGTGRIWPRRTQGSWDNLRQLARKGAQISTDLEKNVWCEKREKGA